MNSELTFNPALPTGIKSYYTNGDDSVLGGSDTIMISISIKKITIQ